MPLRHSRIANQPAAMKDQHAIDLDYEMNKALSPVGFKQLLDLIAQKFVVGTSTGLR